MAAWQHAISPVIVPGYILGHAAQTAKLLTTKNETELSAAASDDSPESRFLAEVPFLARG